jgi:Flp pilus assembly pilin Flp
MQREETGAQMLEYVLLVALIAIVVLAAAQIFGLGVFGLFDEAADSIAG